MDIHALRGAAALALVLALGGLLSPSAARADTVAPAAEAPIPTVPVLAAAHHGHVVGGTIRWTTRVRRVVPPEGATQYLLPLAVPTEGPVTVTRTTAGMFEERDAHGALLGFRVAHRALLREPVLEIELDQALASPTGRVRLDPPLMRTAAPQLVALSGSEGLGFVPDEGLGLVQRLGFSAPVDLRARERHDLLRQLDLPMQVAAGASVWLRASAVEAAGGLTGTLTATAERRQRAGLWLGFGLLLGVAFLAILLRGLDRPARVEEAEEVLRQEFAARPQRSM